MQTKTEEEHEFIAFMLESLPPTIARGKVRYFLGGLVAPQTLANADRRGTGPEKAYRIGKHVVYPTSVLLDWVVKQYGIVPVSKIKPQQGAYK